MEESVINNKIFRWDTSKQKGKMRANVAQTWTIRKFQQENKSKAGLSDCDEEFKQGLNIIKGNNIRG